MPGYTWNNCPHPRSPSFCHQGRGRSSLFPGLDQSVLRSHPIPAQGNSGQHATMTLALAGCGLTLRSGARRKGQCHGPLGLAPKHVYSSVQSKKESSALIWPDSHGWCTTLWTAVWDRAGAQIPGKLKHNLPRHRD